MALSELRIGYILGIYKKKMFMKEYLTVVKHFKWMVKGVTFDHE